MPGIEDTEISKAIIESFHTKLLDRVESDVIIVGAGPSGMVGGYLMARQGLKVTIFEKRLAIGGGIWGGGMAMNEVAIQEQALPILDQFEIRHSPARSGLHTVDSVELATGLCYRALQAGVTIFNLMTVEDVCVHQKRVTGVVVNRSLIFDSLPVDPIMCSARATVDATGHEAAVVSKLRCRDLSVHPPDAEYPVEGPLDADSAEHFVAERVSEVFPGLWVSGMSLCATLGGPRMGPIFGGMLLSGQRLAQLITASLQDRQ